jgi:hypothetical protein
MVSTSLSKMGYSCKASRVVVFGPRRYLRIGLRHLYYKQGIGQTLQLLKHIRSDSNLGSFLQIGLDWTQLHAGVSFPIMENPQQNLPRLERGWYTSMREFLASIDASIYLLPTPVTPTLLRAKDCILMEDLLKNEFTPREIKKINLCRLILQVESLAEICTPTGNCILEGVWRGERPCSSSKFLWPRQARPHAPSWQIWRCFPRIVYLHPSCQSANKNSIDLRREEQLGPWTGDRHRETRRWHTYVSIDGETLYRYRQDQLFCSTRTALRIRHNHRFPRTGTCTRTPTLPQGAIPVSVNLSPTVAVMRPTPYPAVAADPNDIPAVPPPTDFLASLAQLPFWQSSLL